MYIIVHLLNDGQATALKDFLLKAIFFQQEQSLTISTDEPDNEFSDLYGYTKEELQESLTALKKAIP